MRYAGNTTCPNCNSSFAVLDRNEDGSPYLETYRCASPGCEVRICGADCTHLSFSCDACGQRFCNEHLVLIHDGTDTPLKCCPACAQCCKPEIFPLAPEPVVRRWMTLAEAGCSLPETVAFVNFNEVA